MKTLLIILCCLFLTLNASAGTVIFQTEFSSLPEGWLSNGWSFGPSGAVMAASYPQWESTLFTARTDSTPAIGAIYFIPDGTDSVRIGIPYYLYAMVNEGYAGFFISVVTEPYNSITIWEKELYWMQGLCETGVVVHTFDWSGSGYGNWIGFLIESIGGYGAGGSVSVLWKLHSLTVTAYGDSLELNSSTWAGIKSSWRL